MLTEFTTLTKYRLPIQRVIHCLRQLPVLQQVEINYMLTWDELRKAGNWSISPPPTGRGNTSNGKETNTSKMWKLEICALYLDWTVLLTIERRVTAWQVNKPIQDTSTLTAECTMGSGYTRGRLPYFQLRYSWRLQASMWRRVPCYRKSQRHSLPNEQTFSVTAETTRNLARYLWASSTPTGADSTTEKYYACEMTSS
jgi:hypothetical protein